jgi:hypothetical protein
MKKIIYYAAPFVAFPLLFFLAEWMEIIFADFIQVFFCSLIFLLAALFGNLSRSKRKFDYAMTLIVPISLCFALFLVLFFSEDGCSGVRRYSLSHALNIEYYKLWMPIFAAASVITFIASFKPIRIINKLRHISKK